MYHCGSDEGWSDVFSFKALNDSASFNPRFALYGDLGNENPQSLARLQKETQLGMYDVFLHIGEVYTRTTALPWTLSERDIRLFQPEPKPLVIHRYLAEITADYINMNQIKWANSDPTQMSNGEVIYQDSNCCN